MTKILENYREFDHSADLNAAIRIHLQQHRYKLNKTAFSVFEKISRYAVKHGGAAWLKVETLADMLGKSKPTIRRAVALLESLGMVERVARMRPKRGGNGGNVIRILPPNDRPEMIAREEAVEPVVSTEEAVNQQKESTTLKISNNVLTNTWADANVPLYRRMINYVESVLGEGNQSIISTLYGVYKARSAVKEIPNTIAFEAFRTSVTAIESSKIKRPGGYYSRVIDRMLMPAKPIREEMLPAWFTAENEGVPAVDTDAVFLAEKAALEAALKARKREGKYAI